MILVGLVVAVVVFLAAAPGWLAGPFSWLLVVYVVWRAWPAIRSDLSGIRAVRPPVARRAGGAHL